MRMRTMAEEEAPGKCWLQLKHGTPYRSLSSRGDIIICSGLRCFRLVHLAVISKMVALDFMIEFGSSFCAVYRELKPLSHRLL